MEEILGYVTTFSFNYLFSYSGIVTHLAFIGLLIVLAKRCNIRFGRLIWLAFKLEFVQLTLWLILPYQVLSIFLTLWYFLNKFEEHDVSAVVVSRPRVDRLYETTFFISDYDLGHWLKSTSGTSALTKDLSVSTDPQSGRQRINSSMQCIRREEASSTEPAESFTIELNSIKSISLGCRLVLLPSENKFDIQNDRCLSLECGADGEIIVLLVDSPSTCTDWLALLNQITGVHTDSIEKQWLSKLVSAEWLSGGDISKVSTTERNFGIDEAYSVLQKAKKNVDRNYLTELFKTIAKPNAVSGKKSDAKLNIEEFVTLFRQTAVTSNIQTIFNRLRGNSSVKTSISAKTFYDFVLSQQKEQVALERALSWIIDNEPVLTFGNLSVAGFSNYLTTDENSIFNRDHRVVYQDMTQPLSHYFIATSHNTYLTGDQLKSKSSVDAYISALKRGCKCVELDCWDGPNNEPIIYHGHTLTSKILFKDVIQAIKDYAFCVSQYPVILSFENHCSVEQQRVMATHLKTILGSFLHTEAIPEDQTCLPSPEDLKGYVLVKAKKYRPGDPDDSEDDTSDDDTTEYDQIAVSEKKKTVEEDTSDTTSIKSDEIDDEEPASPSFDKRGSTTLSSMKLKKGLRNSVDFFKKKEKKEETIKENPKETAKEAVQKPADDDATDTVSMKSDDIDDEEPTTASSSFEKRGGSIRVKKSLKNSVDFFKKQKKDETIKETSKDSSKDPVQVVKIAQELSDLVTYCQATGFKGFEYAKQNCKHYQMSSFGEKKVIKFTRESPISLLQYNQRQLSRTYPGGVRVDSSNYDPVPMWAAGCQLVALNYQTPCREMQLNQGLFQDNGGCGYVLKPEFMRSETITYDPRTLSPDVYTLTIKIIYGHQIPYKSDKLIKTDRSLTVHVRTAGGVEANYQTLKTSSVRSNGYHPVWDDELTFKLHTPDFVLINIAVYTKESLLAQFTVPFSSLMQGYRKIPLQNKFSEPISNAYLMANIAIQTPI